MLASVTRQLGRQRALAAEQQLAALLPAAQGLLATLQQLWTADAACMQQIRQLSAATARHDPAAAAAAAAACRQQARWYAKRAAKRTAAPHPAAIPANTVERFSDDEDEELGVLRLPDDLSELEAINPQLRRVVEAHRAMQQRAPVLDMITQALEEASPDAKRPTRVTKTALGRLKVDTLRSLLEELGDDTRGTKEALVARVLRIAGAEDEMARQQAAEAAALQRQDGVQEGVVSRRQLAAQAAVAKRLAAAAERGGYGVPEASLRAAHRQLAEAEVGDYSRIFSPEEVADILLEARADDIAIIDVRGECPFTDWMVLATARSQRLAHMLAAGVLHALKARAKEVAPGVAPTIEGALDDSEWMVVDAGSVVVHIFQGEEWRREYDLEGLWGRRKGANIRHIAPKKTVHTLDSLRA